MKRLTAPESWARFQSAAEALRALDDGVGVVVTEEKPPHAEPVEVAWLDLEASMRQSHRRAGWVGGALGALVCSSVFASALWDKASRMPPHRTIPLSIFALGVLLVFFVFMAGRGGAQRFMVRRWGRALEHRARQLLPGQPEAQNQLNTRARRLLAKMLEPLIF
ncbi:MAG: hypothetical protein JNG84_07665 [Archangium sp.]|nr:hypothetical protein [Archangium sp.]